MSDTYQIGNISQDLTLPYRKGQNDKWFPILTGMAKEISHSEDRDHFLSEHLRSRGWNQRQLADAIDVTEAAVSRWCTFKRKLDIPTARQIERTWGLPKGALFKRPTPQREMSQEEFLSGLSDEGRRAVIDYRELIKLREGRSR